VTDAPLVEAAATPEEREALGFRQWPSSGEQSYRVTYKTDSGGLRTMDVPASTGDEAAEKALTELGGGKVTNIAPAPQQRRATLGVKDAA
jgi:hypothetical protein